MYNNRGYNRTKYLGSNNKRSKYRQTANETISILNTGVYKFGDKIVDISKYLDYSIENSKIYKFASEISFEQKETIFGIYLETTLNGCWREYNENNNVCALNFASAKNPGGGFLNGANAQEESLCRASGLYSCIKDNEIYEYNRVNNRRCLYSHYMIYSPLVPVFRDNNDKLLEKPYRISFITAPAVNTKEALKRNVSQDNINNTMYERIIYLLSVAVKNKVDVLVLGSWGCGVFGGDIRKLGEMFYELLNSEFRGAFTKVIFSTLSSYDYNILCSIFN